MDNQKVDYPKGGWGAEIYTGEFKDYVSDFEQYDQMHDALNKLAKDKTIITGSGKVCNDIESFDGKGFFLNV